MPKTLPNKETIARILADRLDDRVFSDLFPEHQVTTIRRILRGEPGTAVKTDERLAFSCHHADSQQIASTPVPYKCRLFTDGASRGNPGLAGAGAILYNDQGKEMHSRFAFLGTCTNNVAEYRALLLGLQDAKDCGCKELEIYLDSELIVRQIQGRYKVKNEQLQELFKEVRALLASFSQWSIAHVPRSQNARADALANEAIDSQKKN